MRPERGTLVFVHGLSGSLSAWYPFEEKFAGTHNLLTFDLRGHGFSVRPGREGYAIREFVADLHALLQETGIERCTLVAHSFGSLIAMEYAKAHPERVARAVFIAPPYQAARFGISRILTNIAATFAFFPLRFRSYGRTDYAPFRPTRDYSLVRIMTDISNMGLRSYLLCMREIFARDYDPDWKALAMPILILHGRHDGIVPYAHAEALKQALPHATLEGLDGNHILVLNNVDEVAARIEKFSAQ